MNKKYRHGFKTEAENYALDFRKELGLEPHASLCPWMLAEHLAVPVLGIKGNPCLDEDVTRHWANHPDGAFSGLIIADGTYKEVHHNDFQHPRRQNSDIAHELAHIILGHDLTVPIKDNGERAYDRKIEDEAKWLGATLLLPKKATMYMVLNNFQRQEVEDKYQVSYSLYQYRIQVTDTMRAVKNTRRKYS